VELTGKGNSRTVALTEHQICERKLLSADGREKGNQGSRKSFSTLYQSQERIKRK